MPSALNRGDRRPPPRRASYNDALGETSDSDDESLPNSLHTATGECLDRSIVPTRSLSYSAALEPSSIEQNMKRMSNISQSSCSSVELLTPDPRKSGFNLDFKSSMTPSSPWSRVKTPTEHGLGLGKPIKAAVSRTSRPELSSPSSRTRNLPRPTRQVKGWGPPEILIDEESDDELVCLSSSDDEACLAPKQGGLKMSSHFDFESAKRRSMALHSNASRRISMAIIDDDEDGWVP